MPTGDPRTSSPRPESGREKTQCRESLVPRLTVQAWDRASTLAPAQNCPALRLPLCWRALKIPNNFGTCDSPFHVLPDLMKVARPGRHSGERKARETSLPCFSKVTRMKQRKRETLIPMRADCVPGTHPVTVKPANHFHLQSISQR